MAKAIKNLFFKCCFIVIFSYCAISDCFWLGGRHFFGYANPRSDQALPKGCSAKWNDNKQRITMRCPNNGGTVTEWPYEMSRRTAGINFFNVKKGSVTGATKGDSEKGISWVSDPEINEEGLRSLRVCSSYTYVAIEENCVRINENQTKHVSNFGGASWGTGVIVGVKREFFDYTNSGTFSAGVNSAGYVYFLYDNTCPYAGSDSNCTQTDTILPTANQKNCYLIRDKLAKGCPPARECECKDDICNSDFTLKTDSPKFNQLVPAVKQCYICNATSRKAYDTCKNNVQNREPEMFNLYQSSSTENKRLIESLYGVGTYLCGYIKDVTMFLGTTNIEKKEILKTRIGCLKVPPNVPPRYFPRIARADNDLNIINRPGAHLFMITASVRPFRNDNINKGGVGFNNCNHGPEELGERHRGTFFKPKMIIRFGHNEKPITFTPRVTNMELVYGPTTYNPSQTSIASPWNEDRPVPVTYGKYADSATCTNYEEDTSKVAHICTRLEYNIDDEVSEYVAYQIEKVETSPTKSCEALFNSNELIRIGSVIRPPLKYMVKDRNAVVPIIVESGDFINLKVSAAAKNIVRVLPNSVPTEMSGYHTDVSPMSAVLQADFYDAKKNQLANGNSCAILFTKKFCIAREPCAALIDFPDSVKTAAQSLCNSTDVACNLYKQLNSLCVDKTFCSSIATTIDECKKYSPRAALLKTMPGSIDTYYNNIQWSDETCISHGFEPADHSSALSDNGSDGTPSKSKYYYGQYSDPTFDVVFAYKNHQNSNITRKPFRSGSKDSDWNNNSIIAVPISFINKAFDVDKVKKHLEMVNFTGDRSIASVYLPKNCDAQCISETVTIRNRSTREYGLCSVNIRERTSWPDLLATPVQTDIYMPLKCQFAEIMLHGPGSAGFGRYGNKITAGAAGSQVKGMFHNINNAIEFLHITVGHSGKTPCGLNGPSDDNLWSGIEGGYGITYVAGQDSVAKSVPTSSDVMPIVIINAQQGKNGLNYMDRSIPPGEYNVDTNYIKSGYYYPFSTYVSPGVNMVGVDKYGGNVSGKPNAEGQSTDSSPLGQFILSMSSDKKKFYLAALKGHVYEKGAPAGWAGGSGTTPNVGGTLGSLVQAAGGSSGAAVSPHPAVRGSGGGVARDSRYVGVIMNNEWFFPGLGGEGFGHLSPAKIRVIGDKKEPEIDNNGYKIPISSGIEDKDCNYCPRINVKMNINGKEMVCEYGGIAFGEFSGDVNTSDRGSQVPTNHTALPTKCVDQNGKVYVPDPYYAISRCPKDEKVITSINNLSAGRFYGMCFKESEMNGNFLKSFMKKDKIIFTGTGKICSNLDQCDGATVASHPNGIVLFSELNKRHLYLRTCMPGGFWGDKLGFDDPNAMLTPVSDPQINFHCPALNSTLVGYDSDYSYNAHWPETPAGDTAASTQCKDGYVPPILLNHYARECDMVGRWRAISSVTNSNPCLYSCQALEDPANFIKWPAPKTYTNPISEPECMEGPVKVYTNGREVIKYMKYFFPTDTTASMWQKTCIIPAASNPKQYSWVDEKSPSSLLPSWEQSHKGTRCVPPSFVGGCIDNLEACYDAEHDGNLAKGSCKPNYIHTIYGLPARPPSRMVSGTGTTPYPSNTNASVTGIAKYIECTILKTLTTGSNQLIFTGTLNPPANGDYTCSLYTDGVDVIYNDNGKDYSFSVHNPPETNFNIDTLTGGDADLKNIMKQYISIGRADRASQCNYTNAMASQTSNASITDFLKNNHFCTQVCFWSTSKTLKAHQCDEVINNELISCTSYCGTDEKTFYYTAAQGISDVAPPTNAISSDPDYQTVVATNSQACIGKGLSQALVSLNAGGLSTARIGQFCDNITFKVLSKDEQENKIVRASPSLQGNWHEDEGCWQPRNCTVYTTKQAVAHNNSIWIAVFDQEAALNEEKFTYSSTKDPILCSDNTRDSYTLQSKGAIVYGLYCHDGRLFRIDKLPLSYRRSDDTTCALSNPSVARHISEMLLTNTTYLMNYVGHTDPESLPVDQGAKSTNYYNSLPVLTRYLDIYRETSMKTTRNMRKSKSFEINSNSKEVSQKSRQKK